MSLLGYLGVFVGVLGGVAWLGIRIRRRGIGDAVANPVDELFYPTAHRYRREIQQHEERMTPIPSPGDKPLPGRREPPA